MPWMYVLCSEVRYVEFSNECDKILKIPNEQTEPTDYYGSSTDVVIKTWYINNFFQLCHKHMPIMFAKRLGWELFVRTAVEWK